LGSGAAGPKLSGAQQCYSKDTRAVTRPIKKPRKKDPENTPMKTPTDSKKRST